MVHLHWARARGGAWCDLERVNLGEDDTNGIFVVWHGGPRPRTLRVGYGRLGERIRSVQRDAAILRYRQAGPLHVTWAAVPSNMTDGIMRYLGGRLMPVYEDRARMTPAILANLPG